MPALENAKQEKFAQNLVAGMSQRKAYRAAFPSCKKWKDKTVDNRASELYNTGEVLGRINELLEEAKDAAIMNRKDRMVRLSEIAKSKVEETRDQIRAIDTMNKMDGVYTNKVEVTGSMDLGVKDKKKAAEEYIESLLKSDE